jgi:tetratricopeptide (TPR) repeat protein
MIRRIFRTTRTAGCAVGFASGFPALLAAMLACSSPEERVAGRVARAEDLVREQRGDEALLELESALVIDPRSAAVHQRIGELLADRGDADAAAVHFGDAYQLDPDRVEAALRQAALLATREPQRAEEIVAHASETHPGKPAVHRTAAAVALARGDLAQALASARAAIALDSTRRESWMQLGAVERARAADLRARGAPPEPALASALDAYSRADSLAGGDVAARVETARTLAAWPARRAEATAAFRAAIALAVERSDPRARHDAAAALEQFARRRADAPLAVEALRHEVSADPEKIGGWERLAAATDRAHGAGTGEEVLRELVRTRPDWPPAQTALSAYLAESDRAGARALLRRAEKLAQLGQLAPAEADAMRALELAPDLPRAVDVAFRIHAAQHRLDLVQQSLEEAEAADALRGGARALLARIYLERGDSERARALLRAGAT